METTESKKTRGSKIIAVVGLTGSGKSVATDFFINKGFHKIRFGDITIDILKERGLEINEKNEREIREGLRKEFGMGAYAVKNIPKIEASVTLGQDVVIDGLYSWTELKILKDRFPEIKILAIQTSPEIRYERLSTREIRPLTTEEAASRDFSEIENIEKIEKIVPKQFDHRKKFMYKKNNKNFKPRNKFKNYPKTKKNNNTNKKTINY